MFATHVKWAADIGPVIPVSTTTSSSRASTPTPTPTPAPIPTPPRPTLPPLLTGPIAGPPTAADEWLRWQLQPPPRHPTPVMAPPRMWDVVEWWQEIARQQAVQLMLLRAGDGAKAANPTSSSFSSSSSSSSSPSPVNLLRARCGGLEKRLASAGELLDSVVAERDALRSQGVASEARAERAEEETASLRSALGRLHAERREADWREREVQEARAAAQAEHASLRAQLEAAVAEGASLRRELLCARYESVARARDLRGAGEELGVALAGAREGAAEARREAAGLAAERDSLRASLAAECSRRTQTTGESAGASSVAGAASPLSSLPLPLPLPSARRPFTPLQVLRARSTSAALANERRHIALARGQVDTLSAPIAEARREMAEVQVEAVRARREAEALRAMLHGEGRGGAAASGAPIPSPYANNFQLLQGEYDACLSRLAAARVGRAARALGHAPTTSAATATTAPEGGAGRDGWLLGERGLREELEGVDAEAVSVSAGAAIAPRRRRGDPLPAVIVAGRRREDAKSPLRPGNARPPRKREPLPPLFVPQGARGKVR
jgi:hypothetical protein